MQNNGLMPWWTYATQDNTLKPFGLPKTYNVQRDLVIGCARLINMYSIPAQYTNNNIAHVPASGFKNELEIGAGASIRAQRVFKDKNYIVVEDSIWQIDTALTQTFIGNINTTSGYVGIAENVNEIVFVDGVDLYIWNTQTSTFTVPVGLPFVSTDISALDGYLVAIDKDTNKWYQSALNDATMWGALDFVVFSSVSDTLVAIRVIERRIHVFGQKVIEVWEDAGSQPFAFARNNNALIEHGCISPATIATTTLEGKGVMLYVARNDDGMASVSMLFGISNPKRVSDEAIELFLQNASNIYDATAFVYKENGLTFYQLSFTDDNRTFVFVLETNAWHELSYPNGDRHPAGSHAFFNNKHYIGMYNENKIYEQSYKFFDYNGELIRCILVTNPLFAPTHATIRIDKLELEVIQGLQDGNYANQLVYDQLNELITKNERPKVLLFISRDGGRTYGNGLTGYMGKLGEYKFRTIWYDMGVMGARRYVFKFEFPYKVPFLLLGAYIQAEVLPE